MIYISKHGEIRIEERNVPQYVLDALEKRPLILLGMDEYGYRTNYRVVRVSKHEYWVGIESDNTLITVISPDDIHSWLKPHLFNYEAARVRICRLAIVKSWQEQTTEYLAQLWGVELNPESLLTDTFF